MSMRVFTLEEANHQIPAIRDALLRIRDVVGELVPMQDRLSVLMLIGAPSLESPEHREFIRLQGKIEKLAVEYNERLGELQEVGCLVKDLNHGLVDFYHRKGRRLVFLCWRLGEEQIEYWHEIDGGYAGRRPIRDLENG
ncbi:MAG: DUF2203 family protein [Candidatus Eisenbacteria bacterium]|nr:DUF2203 family protein [Candidatus Latescibacterota bacterium]MBD3303313.1 DUF2203 family protein [Candidatus Eisenbacteria bacterium]